MGALEFVLGIQKQKQQNEFAQAELIKSGFDTIADARKERRKNQIDFFKTEVALAKSGLGLKRDKETGRIGIERRPDLEDPLTALTRQTSILDFMLKRTEATSLGLLNQDPAQGTPAPAPSEATPAAEGDETVSEEKPAGDIFTDPSDPNAGIKNLDATIRSTTNAEQALRPSSESLINKFGISDLLKQTDPVGARDAKRRVVNNMIDVQKKQAEVELQQSSTIGIARDKEALLSDRDYINGRIKISNQYDIWLDMIDQQRQFGLKPGPVNGVVLEVMGRTRSNEFWEAFVGGQVEYAAAIGRIAIPGARAVRLINIFKKSSPTVFSTVPSSINNIALSAKNALATDMSRNPNSYEFKDANGNIIDRNKNREAWLQVGIDSVRRFETMYKESAYRQAYNKHKDLAPDDWRKRFDAEDNQSRKLDEILAKHT